LFNPDLNDGERLVEKLKIGRITLHELVVGILQWKYREVKTDLSLQHAIGYAVNYFDDQTMNWIHFTKAGRILMMSR